MTPETHFAENDGVSIAYQVFGDGPQDLIGCFPYCPIYRCKPLRAGPHWDCIRMIDHDETPLVE